MLVFRDASMLLLILRENRIRNFPSQWKLQFQRLENQRFHGHRHPVLHSGLPSRFTIKTEVLRWMRPMKVEKIRCLEKPVILLMEEILHHLGCIKPSKWWDKLPINWCRISSINSTIMNEWYPLISNSYMIDICKWNVPWPHDPRKEGVCEAPTWKCYPTGLVNISHLSTNDYLVVWDCRGTPKNPNPFHRGIPEIQTTNPNQQLTISWTWGKGK